MRWLESGCLAAVLVIVAACTSAGETEISRTVAGFVGQPREAAIARLGRPNKVIIDFQGGGACWNDTTCGFADALFSDSTGDLGEFTDLIDRGVLGGGYREDAPGREVGGHFIGAWRETTCGR